MKHSSLFLDVPHLKYMVLNLGVCQQNGLQFFERAVRESSFVKVEAIKQLY